MRNGMRVPLVGRGAGARAHQFAVDLLVVVFSDYCPNGARPPRTPAQGLGVLEAVESVVPGHEPEVQRILRAEHYPIHHKVPAVLGILQEGWRTVTYDALL